MEYEDTRIIEQLKNGAEYGARLLFNKYAHRLNHVAENRFGLKHDDAVTVTTDTLIKVINNIQSFTMNKTGDFRNWIFAIFRNTIFDLLRKQKNRADFCDYVNELDSDLDKFEKSSGIEIALLQKIVGAFLSKGIKEDDRINLIVQAFNELKENEQIIFYCYLNGYQYKEISEYVGETVANLKVKSGRIIKKFLKIISKNIPIDQEAVYEEIRKLH